jgi:trans-aconitate 2-methyltransferase
LWSNRLDRDRRVDPDQYQRYRVYRDRPALDLMVRLPGDYEPANIWDLGCGAGEHAGGAGCAPPQLHAVFGLNSSRDAGAERAPPGPGWHWVQGDIATFAPPTPPDLIFTNAALQWGPGSRGTVPRLAGMLAPGECSPARCR